MVGNDIIVTSECTNILMDVLSVLILKQITTLK